MWFPALFNMHDAKEAEIPPLSMDGAKDAENPQLQGIITKDAENENVYLLNKY